MAVAVAAAAIVFVLLRVGASPAALALLPLILLPWFPLPVPPVLLVWAGRLRLLVWAAVLLLLVVGPARRLVARGTGARLSAFVGARPRWAAGLLSAIVFGAAAWIAAPSVPGGDEPHYLVITQSLLLDGDLRIENNHQRGDYESYYPGTLRPDYIRRGRDGQIYSIHAPGISVLVLPAFALGGYPAVVVFLVALAAVGGALLWHVAWLATGRPAAAWFGWAAVALSPAHIFHTFTVYPDGAGGLVVLTGIWALLRDPERTRVFAWALHGAALSALPWLHTRFALLAGSIGALVLLRLSRARDAAAGAVAFLVVPAVAALCWIGYFIAIYGTPDPSAPYGTTREFSTAFIPGGLAGLLFDQRFGLLATAPVLASAFVGVAALVGSRGLSGIRSPRRLAFEMLFVAVPYLLVATSYAMWWAGWSAPARFAVVVLPAFGVLCAAAWASLRTHAGRTIAAGGLGLTIFISTVLLIPHRGRLAFNTRDVPALWLDWASQVADLGRGLPLWVRGGEAGFFATIVLWGLAMLAAGLIVRLSFTSRRAPASLEARATTASLVFAAAAMMAVSGTWRLNRVEGTTPAPAQLEYLRRLAAEPRVITGVLHPLERIAAREVIAAMRIEPGGRYSVTGGAGRNARPMVTLPAVPAGRYRIRPRTTGGDGLLTIGIGQDPFLLKTAPLASPPEPIEIEFPVDVRALIVSGDEAARRTITGVSIEPIATLQPSARLATGYARTGLRYDDVSVFFLDERGFPEPEGFWVGGARQTSIVIQPDTARQAIAVSLRNAPVPNHLSIEAGRWRLDLDLAPGESRVVSIPIDAQRGAALVTFSSRAGFRPSAVEPGSRDHRFLGVWVQVGQR